MTSSQHHSKSLFEIICCTVIILLLSGLLSSFAATAQPTEPSPAPTATQPSAEEVASQKAWHATMSRTPLPKKSGCFKGTYPSTEWQEVPCTTAPNRPYPQASGPQPVGAGNDFSARVSGTISSAVGSFVSVTGVTSVSDPTGQSNFALQLNSNPFQTSSCNPSASPQCQGWQQFIFSNSGSAFIQYWLLNYTNNGAACPVGWNTFKPTPTIPGTPGCWRNSTNAATVPVQNITNLAQLSLTGKTDGGTDTVAMSTATNEYQVSNPSWVNLAANWQAAEFNVFGDCCSTRANFNSGVTIVVKTAVDSGTSVDPVAGGGFTAETNNLNLVTPRCLFGGSSPAIVFTESNAAGATAPQCVPPPVCNASTDCTGELTISCTGPDVGVSFNGNCKSPSGEPVPCFAGFTGASTVSAGGNVEWTGSTTSPNVAEACTENSAGESCILVTTPVPAACPSPPVPPVPQCGLNEKWCFKFEPHKCAPIRECLVTPPHP